MVYGKRLKPYSEVLIFFVRKIFIPKTNNFFTTNNNASIQITNVSLTAELPPSQTLVTNCRELLIIDLAI